MNLLKVIFLFALGLLASPLTFAMKGDGFAYTRIKAEAEEENDVQGVEPKGHVIGLSPVKALGISSVSAEAIHSILTPTLLSEVPSKELLEELLKDVFEEHFKAHQFRSYLHSKRAMKSKHQQSLLCFANTDDNEMDHINEIFTDASHFILEIENQFKIIERSHFTLSQRKIIMQSFVEATSPILAMMLDQWLEKVKKFSKMKKNKENMPAECHGEVASIYLVQLKNVASLPVFDDRLFQKIYDFYDKKLGYQDQILNLPLHVFLVKPDLPESLFNKFFQQFKDQEKLFPDITFLEKQQFAQGLIKSPHFKKKNQAKFMLEFAQPLSQVLNSKNTENAEDSEIFEIFNLKNYQSRLKTYIALSLSGTLDVDSRKKIRAFIFQDLSKKIKDNSLSRPEIFSLLGPVMQHFIRLSGQELRLIQHISL